MPDFADPGLLVYPAAWITSVGPASGMWDWSITARPGGATAGAWPANNRAIYLPFFIERVVTAFKMSVEVTTQSGNLDMGIYDENFARLVSLGSTAVAAAGLQVGDIADTVLTPGLYYMAMNCSTTAAAFSRQAPASVILETIAGGRTEDVGAVALPATATPVTPVSAYIPTLAVGLKATH